MCTIRYTTYGMITRDLGSGYATHVRSRKSTTPTCTYVVVSLRLLHVRSRKSTTPTLYMFFVFFVFLFLLENTYSTLIV